MGRHRGKLTAVREGQFQVVRFRHPLLANKRILRVNLGIGDAAEENLRQLNNISQNKDLWRNPPRKLSQVIYDAWYTPIGIGLQADVKSGALTHSGQPVPADPAEVLTLNAILAVRDATIVRLKNRIRVLEKHNEQLLGRKVRTGPCPTLEQACKTFMEHYTGHDVDHTTNVENALNQFIKEFKKDTEVDKLDGKELKINAWLGNLKVSPSRRHFVRIYVLKMLEQSGLRLDRNVVKAIKAKAIRESRGPIRWVSRAQAEKIRDRLGDPWRDMWRVQVNLGLRPDEIITLKRGDFADDFSELTLSPFEELTLKTGPRTLQIPMQLRPLFEQRLANKKQDFVFPEPNTGKVWVNAKAFNKRYKKELRAAAGGDVSFTVDCRLGRRTAASLKLREKRPDGSRYSLEDIATWLGDTAEMVYRHYGRILAEEIDPHATVL